MYHACGTQVHIHIVFTLRHVHTQVTPMCALNADDQQCTMHLLMCIAVAWYGCMLLCASFTCQHVCVGRCLETNVCACTCMGMVICCLRDTVWQ